VLKINPAVDAIVFGALIGGDGGDSATTVSVDPGGNVYLAGSTSSTNFPLKNPLQTFRRGILDAFAVKIDASGSTLLFSTYLGGEGIDSASSLAVAGDGNLYLTGSSDSGDFPLVNAFQTLKTGSGAYASDNGGASWSEIGNGLSGGDANDLVIFPGASSTIFAGTDRGVFKSVDGGSSWTLLGGPQFIRNINQLIVDPTSQDILYAVTANQLFKSVNGGATWVLKPLSGVRTIAIDPVTPSKLYAGTIVGLSISSNGGDSWTSVPITSITGGPIGTTEAVTVDPVTMAISTGKVKTLPSPLSPVRAARTIVSTICSAFSSGVTISMNTFPLTSSIRSSRRSCRPLLRTRPRASDTTIPGKSSIASSAVVTLLSTNG
jgi:Beta-propeller repeat